MGYFRRSVAVGKGMIRARQHKFPAFRINVRRSGQSLRSRFIHCIKIGIPDLFRGDDRYIFRCRAVIFRGIPEYGELKKVIDAQLSA